MGNREQFKTVSLKARNSCNKERRDWDYRTQLSYLTIPPTLGIILNCIYENSSEVGEAVERDLAWEITT